MHYAASFGTPTYPSYVEEFERNCYQAGLAWAKDGHTKLPPSAQVGDRKVPIVRSSHPWAQKFVAGWKAGGKGK